MAFVPIQPNEVPNLVTVAKRTDPDGSIASIAEFLTESNPVLEDMPVVESNLATGHRMTIRADMPQATWRKLNYGVRDSKSATEQVDETIGMLEDYAEVDKDLANLNGNSAEFRLSEDRPHIDGMSATMAETLFYGNTAVHPERFLGIAPRYDSLTLDKPTAVTPSAHLKNVISLGGTGSALTSVYYVVWGENTVFGLYPQGSKAGLSQQDLGEVTLFDPEGGKYQGYRTHYQWKLGLAVKDWRYIVRVCNINLNDMDDAATRKALYQAMIKAKYAVPNVSMGRGVFYCSAAIAAMLDIAAVEKENAALGIAEIFGREVTVFRNSPIRPCNAILEAEAQVS